MRSASLSTDEPQPVDPPKATKQPDRERSRLADVDALIAEIARAQTGSAELDARIHFIFRLAAKQTTDVAALLIDHGVTWPTVDAVLGETVPAFTSSLDAALEGEDIELVVRSAKTRRWGAMQKAQCGDEVLVWATTEPLARRLAAISAWKRDAEQRLLAETDKADEPFEREKAPPAQNSKEDWEVLF